MKKNRSRINHTITRISYSPGVEINSDGIIMCKHKITTTFRPIRKTDENYIFFLPVIVLLCFVGRPPTGLLTIRDWCLF